ncbi:unnamed protein product [Thlaspi arvense]|uniref:Uncharacterized protein n=1 Tax=Thlaspi arvense TaxID=13288 RepID=A0AAU9RZ76_THLAR|nr:unnamed protein product [Thlaspi arvense]
MHREHNTIHASFHEKQSFPIDESKLPNIIPDYQKISHSFPILIIHAKDPKSNSRIINGNLAILSDSVYPYISSTGNFDIQESAEFLWNDEEVDVRVDNLTDKIRAGSDLEDHLWESVEATENIDENSSPIEFDDSAQQSYEDTTTTNVYMHEDDLLCSQPSNIDLNISTQEYLQKTMGLLSQDSVVTGFPTETWDAEENNHFSTPKTSFVKEDLLPPIKVESPEIPALPVRENWTRKLFTDTEKTDKRRKKDRDDSLVFVSEKTFTKLMEWYKKNEKLKIGPTIINKKLLDRVLQPREWLGNEE